MVNASDLEEMAGDVYGGMLSTRLRLDDRVARHGVHRCGCICIQRQGSDRSDGYGGHCTLSQITQLRPSQCLWEEGGAFDQGAYGQLVAEHLEGHDQVGGAGAHAAVVLRHDQGADALLCEAIPQRQAWLLVAVGPTAGHCGGVGSAEQLGECLGEAQLFFGMPEIHDQAPFGSRGKDKMRSAMTPFWTSLVPA